MLKYNKKKEKNLNLQCFDISHFIQIPNFDLSI